MVDRRRSTSDCLGPNMTDDRVTCDDNASPGGIDPPAEVDGIGLPGPRRVQAAEPVPHVSPDQGSRGADGEHLVDLIPLPLVELHTVDRSIDHTVRADRDAGLEQPAVVPGSDL